MPRINLVEGVEEKRDVLPYSEVRSMVMTMKEHNRQPGVFDYNYPQTFYSHYPEIDQETYVTLGDTRTASRRVHSDYDWVSQK